MQNLEKIFEKSKSSKETRNDNSRSSKRNFFTKGNRYIQRCENLQTLVLIRFQVVKN